MENLSQGHKWDILSDYWTRSFGSQKYNDEEERENLCNKWFEKEFGGRNLDEISDEEILKYQ
jgi:hypothetical protein